MPNSSTSVDQDRSEPVMEPINTKRNKNLSSSKRGKSRHSKRHHSRKSYDSPRYNSNDNNNDSNNHSKNHRKNNGSNNDGKKGNIFKKITSYLDYKNKYLWTGILFTLCLALYFYIKNKNKRNKVKEESKLDEQKLKLKNDNQQVNNNVKDNESNDLNQNLPEEVVKKLNHYHKLLDMFKNDKENRIVRLKLPEKFLTDDNGAPVVLTPNILSQIQEAAKKEPKKQKISHDEDETLSTDSLVHEENDNVKGQNLTNEEMENIRNQLEMMNKSNNIMASNT